MQQNQTPKPRGRPADTEVGELKAAILDAAEGLFAQHGFAATPVRQIAEKAGANPAMIHYYFGTKESLLAAVLENALAPLAKAIEALQAEEQVSPDTIVKTLMATVAAHPHLPYLVIREVMLPGGVMQAHFARHLAPRLGGALPGLIAKKQDAGTVRPDLPAATCAMIVMSVSMFPFIVRPVAEQVLELRLHGADLEQFTRQVSAFVARGFSP